MLVMCLVDLLKAYSNHGDQVERLRSLLDLPRARRTANPGPRSKQVQKRLTPTEVCQLVAAYWSGTGTKKLAVQFGVHRDTVTQILKREGALRPRGIQPDDLPEAIRLYQDEGWSLVRVGDRFGVNGETVRRTLRKAGVEMRPPGRRTE